MKYRIVLTAAILSALICACCDDIRHARTSMTIADSLMSADPDSSLAILQGMDSSVIERLGKRDMALYTLLLAEAEYKCWMPVDDDTIINESVHYYRHHGPEDMYARALTMQGAVCLERGEYILSLECYKKAEQIIGDAEEFTFTAHVTVTEVGDDRQIQDGPGLLPESQSDRPGDVRQPVTGQGDAF